MVLVVNELFMLSIMKLIFKTIRHARLKLQSAHVASSMESALFVHGTKLIRVVGRNGLQSMSRKHLQGPKCYSGSPQPLRKCRADDSISVHSIALGVRNSSSTI